MMMRSERWGKQEISTLKGKMIYDREGLSYYEGDWINNKKFGYGIRRYPSGNIYEGMWVNDVRHGEGTMRWFDKNQIYAGQWENGVQVRDLDHLKPCLRL